MTEPKHLHAFFHTNAWYPYGFNSPFCYGYGYTVCRSCGFQRKGPFVPPPLEIRHLLLAWIPGYISVGGGAS